MREQDIIELQMQLAFQEDLLDNLNQALGSQQQQILDLQAQLRGLLEEMQRYKEQAQQGDDYLRLLESEKPPHY